MMLRYKYHRIIPRLKSYSVWAAGVSVATIPWFLLAAVASGKHWLHRGFLCIEVRYVEVPLSKFGDNFLFHRELQHVKEFFFASWLSCCMYPELFTTLWLLLCLMMYLHLDLVGSMCLMRYLSQFHSYIASHVDSLLARHTLESK